MRVKFFIIISLCAVLFVADLLLGSMSVAWGEVMDAGSLAQNLVLNYRLPKALVALMVGVALPVSGVLMQTVFRNPLAGP